MCYLGKVENFYALSNLKKQRKIIQNSNMIRLHHFKSKCDKREPEYGRYIWSLFIIDLQCRTNIDKLTTVVRLDILQEVLFLQSYTCFINLGFFNFFSPSELF